MQGFDRSTYGERFASVYDDWYDGITDAEACARFVAELAAPTGAAGGGAVLELGVGTGRLAIPLAALGVEVVGVDASPAMLEVLATKASDAGVRIEGLLGDMAAPPVADRRFAVVLVAYNTLFNLTDPADQQRCLAAAATSLRPGGSVVVEAFVPSAEPEPEAVSVRSLTADRVVLSVSRTDVAGQRAMGQYIDISAEGIALRPWDIRWSTPEQLDALAADEGLVLAERWEDWAGTPFGSGSSTHVSRYVSA